MTERAPRPEPDDPRSPRDDEKRRKPFVEPKVSAPRDVLEATTNPSLRPRRRTRATQNIQS